MDHFNIHSRNTSALTTYLVSGTLVALTVGCSSGTKNNETVQASKTPPEQVVTASRVIQAKMKMESVEDKHSLANISAYHSLPPQLRQVKPIIENTENYQHYIENGIKSVLQEPVSTFSIDVDTGSYTNIRRMINQGMLPPADAIRIEEFINYSNYDYSQKSESITDAPFSIDTAISTSPWAEQRHIMRIGLKGFSPDVNQIMGRNLVFLLDVSGSMNQLNKLPLLTRSLELLTGQLSKQDCVSIVVYAGASGEVLEPTQGNQKAKIKQALTSLSAGGSTNGGAGIELAYNMAEQSFIKGGVNPVILATDGDFNIGVTNHEQLIELIELIKRKRQKGIA
jgi:Ca-activated chloride channel family protein